MSNEKRHAYPRTNGDLSNVTARFNAGDMTVLELSGNLANILIGAIMIHHAETSGDAFAKHKDLLFELGAFRDSAMATKGSGT